MTERYDDEPVLTPEDRRLIDAIAEGYRPEPMNAARRAAFRRALAARLEARDRSAWWGVSWRFGFAGAVAAAAAVVLWVATVETPGPVPTEVARTQVTVPAGGAGEHAPLRAGSEAPIYHAFVVPEADAGEGAETAAYLPDDYLVLAALLDLENGEENDEL